MTVDRRYPSCRCCLHWKRHSDTRGQCWSSARPVVPVPTREGDACDEFTDQMANRATIQEWIRP